MTCIYPSIVSFIRICRIVSGIHIPCGNKFFNVRRNWKLTQKKLPEMLLCWREPPLRFYDVGYFSFIFVLYLLLFFIHFSSLLLFIFQTVFLYLTLFPDIFELPCVYQGLPGSRPFCLEVCEDLGWSTKHRLGPSVCLIHSNPQF